MPPLDSYTLFVASLLFAAGLCGMLTRTRIGMGHSARGLGLWLVGNLLLLAPQFVAFADAPGSRITLPLPAWALTTGLVAGAILAHTLAIRRVQRGALAPHAPLLAGVAAFALGAVSLQLPGAWSREVMFHMVVFALLSIQAGQLWAPARRHWGPRVLLGTAALSMVTQAGLTLILLNEPIDRPASGDGQVIMLGVTLLTTSAMLLWLQERVRDCLAQAAMPDALTGAPNRPGVGPMLDGGLARAARTGRPGSGVLCDLDHFKQVNDRHGHHVGDLVLGGFVSRARALLRKGDVLARWGGEEFLVVLPDTACAEAVHVAERVRHAQIAALAEGMPKVTVSAGVATAQGAATEYDLDRLLALADCRLYIAKSTRDRIVACGEMAASPSVLSR